MTQICTLLVASHKQQEKINSIISLWRCNNRACQRTLVAENEKPTNSTTANFVRFIESTPLPPNWPIPIKDLKNGLDATTDSKFIATYMQSLQAENMGLDEIAGMGYRKAIEYLVKDIACRDNPDNIDQIKGKTLTAVVKDYFNGDIKDILERAVWLGNDQTHYFKIFEQFNNEMIKELIDFILADLDREYKKKHYNSTITAYNQPNNNP